jgi:F420-non-reducing hydrogenase small subunit
MPEKFKFAFMPSASCGGCEIAIVDIDEVILKVAELADIVYWPTALDFKDKDLEAIPDGGVTVGFFNGAVRNEHDVHHAHLMRRKSQVLVAFGACAQMGGIPSLGNFWTTEELAHRMYDTVPSVVNPDGTRPQPSYEAPEGELTIPRALERAYALDQVVDVDYYIPGCPPQPKWIIAAVEAVASGELPPKGTVIAGTKAVCDECPRERSEEKQVTAFKRIHLVENDPKKCLLEQGIMCCGPATRDGCEAACIVAGQACRGCFGPTDNVNDMGAKLASAIASIVIADTQAEADRILGELDDPAGYFYRFGLAKSLLGVQRGEREKSDE